MINNAEHLDILYIEKAARMRGYNPAQIRTAVNAYQNGGYQARRLLASLGFLPKMPPEPKPEMSAEELEELAAVLAPETFPDPEPDPEPPCE